MASGSDITFGLVKQPKWDGRPTTFAVFREDISRYLIRQKVAHAIPPLNAADYPAPVGAGHNAQIAKDRASAYVYLADSLSQTDFRAASTQYNDAIDSNEIPAPAGGWPANDNGHINFNPVRLWAAFERYARGPIADLSGPALHDRINAWKWPADAGDGTIKAQVEQAIQELRDLHEQGTLINDPDYPFTEPMACRLFKKGMPDRFDSVYTSYETISRLHALSTRALTDADRFDRAPRSAANLMSAITPSFASGTNADQDLAKEVKELREAIRKLEKPQGRRQVSSSNQSFTRAEKFDESLKPPGFTWCKNHGWSKHKTADCLNSNSKYESDKAREVVKCVMNADGTYRPIFESKITGELCTLVTQGVISSESARIYVDTCCDRSTETSLDAMDNVVKLDLASAPVFDGSNDGSPSIQTHVGNRRLTIHGKSFDEQVYYGPSNRFRLTSTNTLAKLGVSTLVDATKPGGPLTLTLNGFPDNPIQCDRVGNIWQLPIEVTSAPVGRNITAPSINISDDLQSTTSSSISDVVEVPAVPPPQKVSDTQSTFDTTTKVPSTDYSWFRQMIGNPSHQRTVKAATASNIKLVNRSKAQPSLDEQMRIANQSAQPLKKLGSDNHLEPIDGTVIVGDTIGKQFPVSASGNRVAQTWTLKSDPSNYYVTVGTNNTALNSCNGFEQFCKDANLIVHKQMFNSGISFSCDNGTEYQGAFKDMCNMAGIKIVTGVPNKKSGQSGIAEGANAKAQQRMRAQMQIAQDNFKRFGIDIEQYWDYAIKHGAKQDRVTRTMITNANPTPVDHITRVLGAPWGSVGTISLQPEDQPRKSNHKQLSDRGELGIFLGSIDHKHIMLLANGSIKLTTDVIFGNHSTSTTIGSNNSVSQLEPDAPIEVDTINPEPTIVPPPASFHDHNGANVTVGDHVSVLWPAMGATYSGTVQSITPDDDLYSIIYHGEDEVEHEHHLSQVAPMHVTILPPNHTLISKSRFIPHPSVAEYVTPTGDIRESILTGDEFLPPAPPKPIFTQATAPPMPHSVHDALASEYAIWWLHSIVNEYYNHVHPSNHPSTFEPTDIEPSGRVLHMKWVFKIKFSSDTVLKFKSRLCIAGWGLHQGIDYIESYCGSAPIGDLYTCEALAVACNLFTNEIDLVQAYCNASMPKSPSGNPVIVKPAKGTRIYHMINGKFTRMNLLVNQALYGHPSSGFALARLLHNRLLNRHVDDTVTHCPINFRQSATQPVIFPADLTGTPFEGEVLFLWINTDNIRSYYSDHSLYAQFYDWMASQFQITGSKIPLRDQPPAKCNGTTITYHHDSTTFSMPDFIDSALASADMSDCHSAPTPLVAGFTLDKTDAPTTDAERQHVVDQVNAIFGTAIVKQFGHSLPDWDSVVRYYAQHVSTIGWVAKQVGPSVAFAHSLLGRSMHSPSIKSFQAVKRVYKFLKGKRNIGVTLKPDRVYDWRHNDFPVCVMQSDSSFADDTHDRKSQGAMLGFIAKMLCYWATNKSSRVCTSTLHAETYHSAKAARQAVYITQLLQFLGFHSGSPIMLELDNSSTVLQIGSDIRKFTPKSKHFDVDDRFTVQCVEDDILSVKHVPGSIPSNPAPTDGFAVDALTKALPAPALRHYLYQLHGTVGGEVQ